MRTIALAKSGLAVSELGLGAWAMGGSSYGLVDERDARECLEAYVEAGGNFIDTAITYGESEQRIGAFLRDSGARDQLVLASKCRYTTEDEIRQALETSLERLGCDRLDLYYLHSPPDDPETMNRVLNTYASLRDEGVIGAIGASIKGPDVTPDTATLIRLYADDGRVDVLQVIYSILRQSSRQAMEYARSRGVGIVGRTALESGFLSGAYRAGSAFDGHRRRWGSTRLAMILEHAALLAEIAVHPPYRTLAQVAARFALDEPSVDSLIMGAKRADQVRANVEAAGMPALSDELIGRLHRLYGPLGDAFNTGE
jgi:aryl-alcohol dehydrogenase-like predicted oxidoreductase